MSSSVFIESPISANDSLLPGESNSNLVVVYGKNGINVDREGLQTLMEEKNVSSISVVRLTSPTPSMKDEKEEDNENDNSEEATDPESNLKNAAPEIVGLTIEEFYPTIEARKIAKEVMSYAGVVNNLEVKVDYEFQKLVIQHDHCYTPLTSPSQAKSKISAVSGSSGESGSRPSTVKQYINPKLKNRAVEQSEIVEDKSEKETEEEEDGSEYSETSISDSDNDRDSDLDFNEKNFNLNFHCRRRKVSARRGRRSINKIHKKRQSITENTSHNSSVDEDKRNSSPRVLNRVSFDQRKYPSGSLGGQKISPKLSTGPKTQEPQQHSQQPQIRHQQVRLPHKQQQQSIKILQSGGSMSDIEKAEAQLRTVESGSRHRNTAQSSNEKLRQATMQKFVMVKKDHVKSEGGFTDISTLLAHGDSNTSNVKVTELKPEPSIILTRTTHNPQSSASSLHSLPPLTKGFMPLESAVKDQLPAQISLQTHTRTTELAPEHDKQLDLIDSIVKDEMEKSNIIVKNSMNENIPQLVKMLESTEKAILGKAKSNAIDDIARISAPSSSTSSYTTTGVEDIDITNAPLLESAEDELPADILEHVANLIDNKTLQEVIEKEGLTTDALGQAPVDIPDLGGATGIPETSHSKVLNPGSIIPSQTMVTLSPGTAITNTLAGQVLIKKEPIQIVRGNGRVITLPPIEAPTTRAKRRAQTQVVSSTTTATVQASSATSSRSESISSRRSSTNEQKTGVSRKRASTSSQGAPKEDYNPTEIEDEESNDSEDDPNKLWCICRQPHNNRFMICCDVCEDWFHGTCVSITKAMGLEMETNGIEWTCPKCVKKQDPNQGKTIQKKITDIFEKKQTDEPKKIQIESRRTTPTATSREPKAASETTPLSKKSGVVKIPKKSVVDAGSIRKSTESPKQEVVKTATIHKVQQPQRASPPENQTSKMVVSTTTIAKAPETYPRSRVESTNQITADGKPIEIVRGAQEDRNKSDVLTHKVVDSGVQNNVKEKKNEVHSCIVCKKAARINSIYCSDDCIRQHAQNAIITKTKASKATVPTTPEDKKKKVPSSFEEALAKASDTTLQVKNKVERVYVYERKTKRLLTGASAPTTANLKKWLQDNPTFEVVLPGSPQALAIEKNRQQKLKVGVVSSGLPPVTSTSEATTLAIASSLKKATEQARNKSQMIDLYRTTTKVYRHPQQVQMKTLSSPSSIHSPSPSESREFREVRDPKDPVKREQFTREPQKLKKQTSVELQKSSQSTPPSSSHEIEPVRLHMKRTLKEQMISRMSEVKDSDSPKLSMDEIEDFANETENEMFKMFNKDTGAKYKAKYRSLIFNIKDRKNETLFQKICEKKILPKQLVKMSPEELASQELAQWRQNENKHQLEMIKKSELDLLSCAKNYVLKTHKGEEVIESKSTDRVSLDISIPVEDVVTVLNNSAVSSTSDDNPESSMNKSKDSLKLATSFDYFDGDSNVPTSSGGSLEGKLSASGSSSSLESKKIDVKEKDKNREKEKDRFKEKEREKELEKDEVEKDHDRDREKDKEREHERGREREKDKERDREKDKTRERDRHGHKSKSRKRSRSRSRDRDHRHKSPSRDEKRDISSSSSKDRDKDNSKKEKILNDLKPKVIPTANKPLLMKSKDPRSDKNKVDNEHPQKVNEYNLVDKILESTKTVEEAANLVADKEKAAQKSSIANVAKTISNATVKPTSSSQSRSTKVTDNTSAFDSDQEPSSTVTIATPPEDQYKRFSSDLSSIIWNGAINMIDVATFQVVIQPVHGNCSDLKRDLPNDLDVVGRISPDTVWDYISKIKKSPNKEIVVVRLLPTSTSENSAYTALYLYLDKRKRLGVVKTTSANIKDFYILPLGSKKSLPSILQSSSNADVFDEELRPNLLIGIIIRIMAKRSIASSSHVPAKIMRKSVESSVISNLSATIDGERFTPPNSPKNFPSKKHEKSIISAVRLPPKMNSSPIDIDAVINTATSKLNTTIVSGDADEPYSPGGSSDDDTLAAVPVLNPVTNSASIEPIADELSRKMDEINRQIEAQKHEIACILGVEQNVGKNNYTTSSSVAPPPNLGPALANISIPSNLQQILASIKTNHEPSTLRSAALVSSSATDDPEKYIPTPAVPYKSALVRNLASTTLSRTQGLSSGAQSTETATTSTTSRLAQLSEADLLSMVPDDVKLASPTRDDFKRKQDIDMRIGASEPQTAAKRGRWDAEPPPPGVEDEFV